MALDDFGVGWSGPLLQAALPVDYVKLDAASIRSAGLPGRRGDNYTKMAERFIRLACDPGVVVVAEGIETLHQRVWLLERGVTWHQGWLYEVPAPVSLFLHRLAGCDGDEDQPVHDT